MKRTKSFDSAAARRIKLRRNVVIAVAVVVYLVFVVSAVRRRFIDIDAGGAADVGLHLVGSVRSGDGGQRVVRDGGDGEQRTSRVAGDEGRQRYGRITGEMLRRRRSGGSAVRRGNFSEFERMANEAWKLGRKAWLDVEKYAREPATASERGENCPSSMSLDGDEIGDGAVLLTCGLAVGSAITVIGKPHGAHEEFVPQLERLKKGDGTVMVSQFVIELQGLKAVDGEDPPKILHLNPRLKGDWSRRPVLEHNTCFRMQWGNAMRCDGFPSVDGQETVDGFKRCEQWEVHDTVDSKDSRTHSWLKRFVGRARKPRLTWSFPFVEESLFVLTIQAGVEGFHMYVGGRHVSSFPYQAGFTLEDATGLAIKGDVDVHYVYATSLPTSHPSFSPQHVLEMSDRWRSLTVPKDPVHLFIGILSATNHFAERMAIRKTWMQYPALASSNVVARFFVALSSRKEVNAAMKKEADFFNDIVVLTFIDRYELVVLKTIAICDFGVTNLTSAYIMKCDDDTFVRVDTVLNQIDGMDRNKSLYMGNLNLFHKPLRSGKWAVTYEEWPEEVYPPYANGPGYIVSSDIARFVSSQHANHSLRLFKMEDVSVGMWVEDFNATTSIQYAHSWKFCQYGCMENYFISHYQSPRQMLCLWDKLSRGSAQCCSLR